MSFNFAEYDFSAETEFDAVAGDLTRLEIRDADGGHLRYFYDPARGLVKNFIIEDRPRVRTLVNVTLIEKDGVLEPRVRLWKRAKPTSAVADEAIPDTGASRNVKASVDVGSGHATFWKVVEFVLAMTGAEVTHDAFRLVPATGAELAEMLADQNKDDLIAAMRLRIGEELTQDDIDNLTGRREQLEEFRRLLEDSDYFEERREALHGPEAVWQDFFERNQWIFGYGLSFVACESLSDEKLERYTTGADIFRGGGKRSDAVMRTKGYISSLLFGEIKTHKTDLLAGSVYRAPDVWYPSRELIGAVSQIQKTVDKAVRGIHERLHRLREASGRPTGIEVLTVIPRQVLVIGRLSQFEENGAINEEKAHAFELFRRSINGLEILTFDELYERACFIVGDPMQEESSGSTSPFEP